MTENRKQTFAQQAILNRVAEKNAAVTKMRAYNEEYGQYNECGVPAYNELHGDYSEFAMHQNKTTILNALLCRSIDK